MLRQVVEACPDHSLVSQGTVRSFFVLSVLVVTVVGSAGCKSKPRPSPEIQAFVDRCNQVEFEMTEQEVDAILNDYHSSGKERESRDVDPSGKPLKRQSRWVKSYYAKGVHEGAFLIDIYFDEQMRVVGKCFNEVCL